MEQKLIFGQSKKFNDVILKADRYAVTDWPILILGETGVGKELLARRMHENSLRQRGPFIPINCAAMPAGLFESELFGYERGAFSGAVTSSRGLLKAAHGGTLFLDEIGELDLPLQVKLLRAIDSGETRAVGSQRVESVDVRITAATNINPYEAVAQGRFRLDLLERLSVLTLNVPALRERKEDILLIAKQILALISTHAEEESLKELLQFDWPGNVRQLRNILIRVSVMGGGKISVSGLKRVLDEERENNLILQESANQTSEYFAGTLADIEKQVIVERLKRYHGNRKKTAEGLGIAKSTLHEKLRKWKDLSNETSWPLHRFADMGNELSV